MTKLTTITDFGVFFTFKHSYFEYSAVNCLTGSFSGWEENVDLESLRVLRVFIN